MEKFDELNFQNELPKQTLIFDREREIFWGVSKDEMIYKIDPNKQSIEEYFQSKEIGNVISNFTISYDGSLYGIISQNENIPIERRQNHIYKFDPNSKKEEVIVDPIYKDEYSSSLFFDRKANLWLNDNSIMNKKGEWFQVLRSPIFITDRLNEEGINQYTWAFPRILLESSDGVLWFSSINGASWFNPAQGKWCWVTDENVNGIIEDSNMNIWMQVEDKLYKKQI